MFTRYGGTDTYEAELARQLTALGHEVSRWKLAKAAQTYGGGVWAICVDKHELPDKASGTFPPDTQFVKWDQLWERADLVHLTTPHNVSMGYKKLLDTPPGHLVVTFHDSVEVMFNEGTGAMEGLMRIASRIFFVGEVWMRRLRQQRRIPHAEFDAKARYFPHPYTRIATGRIADADPKRVVCASAWRWNKGIVQTVEAAELLANEGYRFEFWTGLKDPQLASFVQTMPGWKHCRDMGKWEWPTDAPRIYDTAAYATNMTTFGTSDGQRTEYPVLEAWDFGVTPIVRSCWAHQGKAPRSLGAPQAGIDCLTADDAATLANAVRSGVRFSQDAFDAALLPHTTVGLDIAAEYESVING